MGDVYRTVVSHQPSRIPGVRYGAGCDGVGGSAVGCDGAVTTTWLMFTEVVSH